VINTNKRLKSGDMVMVKITKAYDYDLEGELV
jgi:ribosomal protein S12 methylthiotransferase